MDPVIDLPVPPLCAVRPETTVPRGERLVVELSDGRKLIGRLERFDGDKGTITISLDGGDRHKQLGMHEIRLLRVPQPRRWLRDDDALVNAAPHSAEPLEFDVEFTDHSSINGITFGYRNGRHGIHLFPVHGGDQYTHLFVPNNAIARHRVGRAAAPAPAALPPPAAAEAAAAPMQTAAAPAPIRDGGELLRELAAEAADPDVGAIHIESRPHGAEVRVRRHGELGTQRRLDAGQWTSLLAELRGATHFDRPGEPTIATGTLTLVPAGREPLALRIHIVATTSGDHDVTLMPAPRDAGPVLGDIGLAGAHLRRLDEAARRGRGLLLVCGSGAADLLHALLRHLDSDDKKIWLLGEAVHRLPATVRHVRPGADAGVRRHALDALLDADPDLVALAPLDDEQLARRAVGAALAGTTQILATIAACRAGEALERLVNMAIPRYELVDALTLVVAQGTARRLCPACKKRYSPTAAELRALAAEYHGDAVAADEPAARLHALRDQTVELWQRDAAVLYRAVGCRQCRKTGYEGHLPLHEMLELSPPVRRALLDGAHADAIIRAAAAAGMKTLRQDGIDKALQGHTDLVQVRAACAR